jgi:hypothetical protein
LDAQKLVKRILDVEPSVLLVAVADGRSDTVIAEGFREGAHFYYPKEYIHNFMMVVPVIVMGSLERLKPGLGVVTSVTIRYEKRVFLFSGCEDMIVVLGFDVSVDTPFADSMSKLIRTIAKEVTQVS